MLTAGTAVMDISPRKPLALFGYPHVNRISTGVHDPILASVLCLRSGANAVLLVSLDLLFLDPPAARELRIRVSRAACVPEEGVFIACTHTHSGPVTVRMLAWQGDPAVPLPDPEYMRWMKGRVEAAAKIASGNAVHAEAAWAAARVSGVGGNRHSENGVTDPEAGLLLVRKTGTRELAALAVVYGMHPTVLHEDSTLVSSDFPHFTRELLRERLGGSLAVLYFTAPAGNQSPRRFVRAQTFGEAERLGRKLGEAVCRSAGKAMDGDFEPNPALAGAIGKVTLPRRPIPPLADARRALESARGRLERSMNDGSPRADVRTHECSVFGAEGVVALAAQNESGVLEPMLAAYNPAEIQVVRVGSFRLAGMPGELFAEYALELKRKTTRGVFPVSLVNGELQGYIVTPEAASSGGYEAANSVFAPEAGSVLVEALCRLASQ